MFMGCEGHLGHQWAAAVTIAVAHPALALCAQLAGEQHITLPPMFSPLCPTAFAGDRPQSCVVQLVGSKSVGAGGAPAGDDVSSRGVVEGVGGIGVQADSSNECGEPHFADKANNSNVVDGLLGSRG